MATQNTKTSVKEDRLSIAEKKIFGKYVSTKGGIISDFSPNNIRALVFGATSFMVIYHTRVNNKTYVVYDYKVGVQTDIPKLYTNINDVRPILKIMSSVRKMSMLEEIVFLKTGTEVDKLVRDVEVKYCINSQNKIREEFSRLRGIYAVKTNLTLTDIEKLYIAKLKYFTGLTECLANYGLENYLSLPVSKNWPLEINLAPQFYALDKSDGIVGMHFNKLKMHVDDQRKKKELKEKNEKKIAAMQNRYKAELTKNYMACKKIYTTMTNLYEAKEPYSKVHWAYPYKSDFIATCIGNRIESETALRDSYKAINWGLLKAKCEKYGMGEVINNIINDILNPLVDSQILRKEKTGINNEEKAEYFKGCLDTINGVLEKCIEVMVYLVYYSYVQYCMQAGHICVAQDYLDYLGEEYKLQAIEYHKEMPRVLNLVLPAKNNENMDSFSGVFKLASKAESITMNIAYDNAIKMLTGLSSKEAV